MSANIEALKASQKSLSVAIDQYASVSAASNPNSADILQAQLAISAAASKISEEFSSPTISNVMIYYRVLNKKTTIFVALRVALDLDLFNLVDRETTIEELSSRTGAEKTLLVRVMRLLVASKHFSEDHIGRYSSTPLSICMTDPAMRDYMIWSFDFMLPLYQALPSFLASTEHHDNTDLSNNVLLKVHGAHLFDYLNMHPTKQKIFDSGMRIQDIIPPALVADYPYESSIQDLPNDTSAITVVDVGGGRGQYLDKIVHDYPDLPGRLILQDTPPVLAGVDPSKKSFEIMAHDFFTSQPIIGAKFYHLRRVLHDWPDDKAYEILCNLLPAFKKNYSRLLIQEWVLPDLHADLLSSMLDLNVMAISGVERNVSQWETLLNRAGFRIVKYWNAKVGVAAIIEAEAI